MMSKSALAFAGLVSLSLLQGCASPYNQEARAYRNAETISESEKLRLAYVFQALLDKRGRAEIYNDYYANPDMVVFMANVGAAQVISGDPLSVESSSTAGTLHLATGVYSLIAEDDGESAMDDASGITLPRQFENQDLDSLEKAYEAARQYTIAKMEAAAHGLNRSFKCLSGCELQDRATVFEMPRNGQEETGYWNPQNLYILFTSSELKHAPKPPFAKGMLGFDPSYQTVLGDQWRIEVFETLEEVDPEAHPRDMRGAAVLTEQFYYQVYDNPYLFRGKTTGYPNTAFYNGAQYRLSGSSPRSLVTGRIVPRTL